MSGGIEQILKKIEENSTDKSIADFLIELVKDEFGNRSGLSWKNNYKTKIEKYSKK